jgi:predicted DNA-binding mobile mystery protein A
MSQAVLAERLGVTGAAVNQLEHAERRGGVTIGKLSEVARALGCTLFYALVPNSTLEQTVTTQARTVAEQLIGYVHRTVALEAQDIEEGLQTDAIELYAQRLVVTGNPWRVGQGLSRRDE